MKNNISKNKAFAQQEKLSMLQLLLELPNYLWLLLSAIFSRSVLVWVDLIDSTNIICRAAFVSFLSKKLKKNLSFQYNYGTGKIEAIASICCDMFLLISLGMVCVFAVRDIMYPKQPSDFLVWILLLKIENIVFDLYILLKQRKYKVDSSFYRAEYAANMKNVVFDGAVFVIVIISYFFRDYALSWYAFPVASLLFAIIFAWYSVLRVRDAIKELVDVTCDEQTQQNIIKVLVDMYDQYDDFIEVKSRRNADQLLIDIYVRFSPDTPYEKIEQFAKEASEKMKKLDSKSVVSLVIQEYLV